MICLTEGSFEFYSFIVIYVICIYMYIQSIKISYIYIYIHACIICIIFYIFIYIYMSIYCMYAHTYTIYNDVTPPHPKTQLIVHGFCITSVESQDDDVVYCNLFPVTKSNRKESKNHMLLIYVYDISYLCKYMDIDTTFFLQEKAHLHNRPTVIMSQCCSLQEAGRLQKPFLGWIFQVNQPLRFGGNVKVLYKGFVLAPVVSETFPFKGSSKIFASSIFQELCHVSFREGPGGYLFGFVYVFAYVVSLCKLGP